MDAQADTGQCWTLHYSRIKRIRRKITGAEEKILKIEGELYEALLNELFDYLAPVQTNGNLLAIMDCLCCFAHNAIQYQYKNHNCTPAMNGS